MSIDSPNAIQDSYHKPTDKFNYIDTYVEYFSEVIFNHQNAIPEPGNRHQKQWQQHKLQQVICDNIPVNNFVISYEQLRKVFFNRRDIYAYRFLKEISPPPEFSC